MKKITILTLITVCITLISTNTQATLIRFLCPAPDKFYFVPEKGNYAISAPTQVLFPAGYDLVLLSGHSKSKSHQAEFSYVDYTPGGKGSPTKVDCHYRLNNEDLSLSASGLPDFYLCQLDNQITTHCSRSLRACEFYCEVL